MGGKIRDDDGGVTEYSGSVAFVVTYDSLCALDADVRRPRPTSRVALRETRRRSGGGRGGQRRRRRRHILAAYRKQVEAQSGKAMTTAEAATLSKLAKEL